MSDVNDDIAYEDDPPHPRYQYKGGGKFDGAIKNILIALIIAGIIGFIAMVFAFNGTLANLRETDVALNGSIENLRLSQEFLKDQVREVKEEQRQIRGRVYRSDGTLAGDFSADKPQP